MKKYCITLIIFTCLCIIGATKIEHPSNYITIASSITTTESTTNYSNSDYFDDFNDDKAPVDDNQKVAK